MNYHTTTDVPPTCLGQVFKDFKSLYHEVPNIDFELKNLFCHLLGISDLELIRNASRPIHPKSLESVHIAMQRRLTGEPIAYITGIQNFYGYDFHVNNSVLIPRPETELLVEEVLSLAKTRDGMRVLDVGTGSGCVALSLQMQRADFQVEAWDISEAALKIARENARHFIRSVRFKNVNALDEATWNRSHSHFDFIVSNPPYIADTDEALDPDVKKFEPDLALFAQKDGLAFYEIFARHAWQRLQPDGYLICEIGFQQAEQVVELFQSQKWHVDVKKDLSGHDRVIIAQKLKGDDFS